MKKIKERREDKLMENNNYVIFEVIGIKHKDFVDVFEFHEDAEYEMSNDKYIRKIVVAADISKVTFYLKNSLEISDESVSEIVEYLYKYLGSMMTSLLKNSLSYSNVLLKPIISVSMINFLGNDKMNIQINDHIQLQYSSAGKTFLDGNNILKKWIQDTNVSNYESKQDKYDILFLLLQGENRVQKYMAIYAYLMSLVPEIYSKSKERQKYVVRYISENCSRVGVELNLCPSNRPGATPTDKEDQFTSLRNRIGHPSIINGEVALTENAVNGLSSIVCCAIEDLPLKN